MSAIDKIEEIKVLYNNGKTQQEIANIIGCTQTSVSYAMIKFKIKTRVGKRIIYSDINKNFFKDINSEENAYFLGLLYADGCVQTKNNAYTTSLKLKNDDKIIIEKFRDIMSPSSPIKTTNKKYCYFRINQKYICDQLISHGCIPNKSLILEFPKTVPDNLLNHFIRGYSDGDGSIYKNIVKNKTYFNTIWKITSTKQFCEQISKILKNLLNINCSQHLSRPKINQITTTLSVGGNNQVEKVLDWIYKDATIYIPRKYDKYIEFKNYRNQISSSNEVRKSSSDTSKLISALNKSSESLTSKTPSSDKLN